VQNVFFRKRHSEAVPWTLEAINKNGLAVFLLVRSRSNLSLIQGNILTGLVNLSINTLESSNVIAFCILSGYIIVVNGFAGGLKKMRWTLKI